MTRLVVPPHGDPTIAAAGGEVLDLERAFLTRALAALGAGVAAPATLAPRDALRLAAARAIVARPGASVQARLRAAGAALAAISSGTAVHLRLDDVELATGTTERAADAAAAASGDAPWAIELEEAARVLASAPAVRLWIDRDQTLIAAIALAARLPARVAIELAGPFAVRHAAALTRLPELARAVVVPDAPAPTWMIAGLPGVTDEHGPAGGGSSGSAGRGGEAPLLEWRRHLPRPAAGAPAWAGTAHASELRTPDALLASGCRVVAIAFASWDADGMVARSGDRLTAAEALAGARRLAEGGCALVGELWLGAPGVAEGSIASTLAYLEAERPCAWMAGFRQFSWDVADPPQPWDGREVTLGELEAGRDLVRTRPFACPGTSTTARLAELLPGLVPRLAGLGGPVAGNCAQAIATRPPAAGGAPRLDEDCAIVELSAGLDGRPGPAWTATNLRTGATLALDPRLGPRLAALAGGGTIDEALAPLPADKRGAFARALGQKGVLEGVPA